MKHAEATTAIDYKLLKISSSAFQQETTIPVKYTCDGENVSPPLFVENIPEAAKCLVLVVDDPDTPAGRWIHWLVWNIPVTHNINENNIHGMEGMNDFKQVKYDGPCQPAGVHRYFFKVYALDALLDLSSGAGMQALEKAMSEHIIGFGVLTGLYQRK